MKFKGKIASVLSLFLLLVFFLTSYNGYTKHIEQQPLKKECSKNKSKKEKKEESETISVDLSATYTPFDFKLNPGFVFNGKVEFPELKFEDPDTDTFYNIGSQLFHTLFTRITPVNAP